MEREKVTLGPAGTSVPSRSPGGLRSPGSMCLWADAMTAWVKSSQVSYEAG